MAESYKSVFSHWFTLMRLMSRTGYPIREVYGQRIYGPHPDHRGIIPPKGSEIFVGKLPRDVFEDDLAPLFSKAGTIYEMRLMMDNNGLNRGYAFITYLDNISADRAVQLLDNYEIINGRNIGVCKSVDNCRLYVGGIPRELTRGDIFAEFIRKTNGVKDVIVYGKSEDPSENRGYAHIVYDTHRAAAIARRELVTGRINLWNTELKVDWAPPESVVDPVVMQRYLKGNIETELKKYLKEVKRHNAVNFVLCVRNLSPDLDEDGVKRLFSLKGRLRISKVKQMRGLVFVHFETTFEAQLALSKINGITIGNRVIEVTWANASEYSIQKPSRFHINSHELYRRFLENRDTRSRDDALKEELNPPQRFNTSTFLPSSISPLDHFKISASKSLDEDYTDLLAAYCEMKDWNKASYDCSLVPGASIATEQYQCRLSVPGVKVSGAPLTVVVTASTIYKAKNLAAYSLLAKARLINPADGTPLVSNSRASTVLGNLLDSSMNGLGENAMSMSRGFEINELDDDVINELSRLSLNDVGNGQGNHGQFQSNSDEVFAPYDSPCPRHGAIPKHRGASAKYGQSSAGLATQENNSAHAKGATNLFYSDYSDESLILRDIMGKKTSDDDASGPHRDF